MNDYLLITDDQEALLKEFKCDDEWLHNVDHYLYRTGTDVNEFVKLLRRVLKDFEKQMNDN